MANITCDTLPAPRYDPKIGNFPYGIDTSLGYKIGTVSQFLCFFWAFCYHLKTKGSGSNSKLMFTMFFGCYVMASLLIFIYVTFFPYSSTYFYLDVDDTIKKGQIDCPLTNFCDNFEIIGRTFYSVGDTFMCLLFVKMEPCRFRCTSSILAFIVIVASRYGPTVTLFLNLASLTIISLKGCMLGDRRLLMGAVGKLIGDLIFIARTVFQLVHPLAFSPGAMAQVGTGLGAFAALYLDFDLNGKGSGEVVGAESPSKRWSDESLDVKKPLLAS